MFSLPSTRTALAAPPATGSARRTAGGESGVTAIRHHTIAIATTGRGASASIRNANGTATSSGKLRRAAYTSVRPAPIWSTAR
jgi:hypothetical protein